MQYGFYLPTRGQTTAPDDIDALVRHGDGWQLVRQRLDLAGGGGDGAPPDVFARSMQ